MKPVCVFVFVLVCLFVCLFVCLLATMSSYQGRIQDFLKGVTWVHRRRTCEHSLCAQRLMGMNPVELGVWGVGALRAPTRVHGQSPGGFLQSSVAETLF